MKRIPYGRQWVDRQDIAAVIKVLKTDWLTQGPKVAEFEAAIAKYCGAKYAVAVSSGTAALHAAYAIAGIGKGDEVITTPMTFAATANAVIYCGGTPVFADIQADTLNIDPSKIGKKITPKTKVIATVDFAGHPCDYHQILKIGRKNKLLIIEDASHALGSAYKGKRVGSFADMTIFSFHPVKTITTGEGGMVLTNNKNFYEKLKSFRQHGVIKKPEYGGWYYEIEQLGYNYRITDFQCALGLSQLNKLPLFIKKRREIFRKYNQAFKDIAEIITPAERIDVNAAWHLYTIQLRLDKLKIGRRKIFEDLQQAGLGVQVHYMPIHLHPFYKKQFGCAKGDFPNAEHYYESAISLPLFPGMTEQDVVRVIRTVKKIIHQYSLRSMSKRKNTQSM